MKAYCTQFTDRECREKDCCMAALFYRLDENKNAIPCSANEWGKQITQMSMEYTKHVNQTNVGDYWISTVWIGVNSGIPGMIPLLFETMIQNKDKWTNYQEKYSTWQEAEEGHKEAVEWVKNGCKDE